jgi:hypothetical protein
VGDIVKGKGGRSWGVPTEGILKGRVTDVDASDSTVYVKLLEVSEGFDWDVGVELWIGWDSILPYGPFNVGDIITGKEGSSYGVTNDNAIMEVMSINPSTDSITVKVLAHKKYENYVGYCYPVNPKDFVKYDGPTVRDCDGNLLKVGDHVAGVNATYGATNTDMTDAVVTNVHVLGGAGRITFVYLAGRMAYYGYNYDMPAKDFRKIPPRKVEFAMAPNGSVTVKFTNQKFAQVSDMLRSMYHSQGDLYKALFDVDRDDAVIMQWHPGDYEFNKSCTGWRNFIQDKGVALKDTDLKGLVESELF